MGRNMSIIIMIKNTMMIMITLIKMKKVMIITRILNMLFRARVQQLVKSRAGNATLCLGSWVDRKVYKRVAGFYSKS